MLLCKHKYTPLYYDESVSHTSKEVVATLGCMGTYTLVTIVKYGRDLTPYCLVCGILVQGRGYYYRVHGIIIAWPSSLACQPLLRKKQERIW
jgi:hypothetical protein